MGALGFGAATGRKQTWNTGGGLWKKGSGPQSAMTGFGNMMSGTGSDLTQLGDTGMYGWKMDPNTMDVNKFLGGFHQTPGEAAGYKGTDTVYGATGSYGPGYGQFKIVKDYQGNQYAVPLGYESYGAHPFTPNQVQENFGQYATGQTPFYSTQAEADAAQQAAQNAPPNLDTLQNQGMGLLSGEMSRAQGFQSGAQNPMGSIPQELLDALSKFGTEKFATSPFYNETRQHITDVLNPELQSRGLLTSGTGLRSIEDAYARAGTDFEKNRFNMAQGAVNTLGQYDTSKQGLITGTTKNALDMLNQLMQGNDITGLLQAFAAGQTPQ